MMALALVRAWRLKPRLEAPGSPLANHQRAWLTLCILIGLFLLGYLAALGLLLSGDNYRILASLTAVVFAGGAWFVLLAVSLSVALVNSLLDASGDLESQVEERTAELEGKAEELILAKLDAEEANRTKSQFLANMSHELRTPLNSVVGFTNILLKNKEGRLGPKDLLYLDRILDNGKHLLGLINDILDLSKVEAGHMEVVEESVELPRLLRELSGQFSAQLREKPVHLRLDIPATVRPIVTDKSRLKQILVNLMGNALKFTSKGEVRVVVAVEQHSRRPARIDVIDTGIGIPASQLDTIFDAFRQVGNTHSEHGGTGLGLSISSSLCRLLGFGISVKSRCADEGDGPSGSTFTLSLLPEPKEPLEEPTSQSDTYQVRPLSDTELAQILGEFLEEHRILVVADGVGIAAKIRRLGCEVVEVEDGATAIPQVHSVPFDLLVLDTAGPVQELLDDLAERTLLRELPMILITDEPHPGPAGTVRHLPRDYPNSQLLTLLWRLLVRRKPSLA